jgi:hypothetical protein
LFKWWNARTADPGRCCERSGTQKQRPADTCRSGGTSQQTVKMNKSGGAFGWNKRKETGRKD